jgi:proteasome assembly chaperone (PAC2) family protein
VTPLTWSTDRTLDRPVLVVALSGLFDAGSAATSAVQHLGRDLPTETIAMIDPEDFYDFQQSRPIVRIGDSGIRDVVWPELHIVATRPGSGQRDLVLLAGVEPHLRWRTFAEVLLEVVQRAGVELVVTMGANPAQVPHTRPPVVFGSSTTAALVIRLGLSRPQYQGPTGVLGVVQAVLDRTGPPAIALRVGVPHYALGDSAPKATVALLRHLEHVTGVPTHHTALSNESLQWEAMVTAAVEADDDVRAYVRQLEALHDRETEQQIASGDGLADEVERFLREQRGET